VLVVLQHFEHPSREQLQLIEADALGDAVASFGTDAKDASAEAAGIELVGVGAAAVLFALKKTLPQFR
jgi:hypothetical protein